MSGEIKTYQSSQEFQRTVQQTLYWHCGRANAITREQLIFEIFGVQVADVSDGDRFDREIREAIEQLRNDGHLICNMGDGQGYFVAVTLPEYQAWRQVYGKHAFPIMKTLRVLDKAAEKEWPNVLQPELFKS